MPIYGLTPEETAYRELALVWGVVPGRAEPAKSFDKLVATAAKYVLEIGAAKPGDV